MNFDCKDPLNPPQNPYSKISKGNPMTFELSDEIVEIGARILAGLTSNQPWPSPLQPNDTLGQTPDMRFHEAMTAESTAFLLAVGPLIAAAGSAPGVVESLAESLT